MQTAPSCSSLLIVLFLSGCGGVTSGQGASGEGAGSSAGSGSPAPSSGSSSGTLTEKACNADDNGPFVEPFSSCNTPGAHACGVHDCSDISSGSHLCTCTNSAWDCGHCGSCGPFILLGASTGIGAACDAPTAAVQCDGTTTDVPVGWCKALDGFWEQCTGVSVVSCSDAGPVGLDGRMPYAIELCSALSICAGQSGLPLQPSSALIGQCVIPVLKSLAGKSAAQNADAANTCDSALRGIVGSESPACEGLAIDHPPDACKLMFQ
jgi:hypothetical protein